MKHLLVLVGLLTASSSLAAQIPNVTTGKPIRVHRLPEIAPIFVERPFGTPKAVDAFRKYVEKVSKETGKEIKVPDDFYRAAPLITYWGYEFEQNSTGTYDVIFTQKFDLSSFSAAFLKYVSDLRYDNCSDWYVTDVRVTSMTSKEIDVAGGMHGTEMACLHNPVGSDFKTKIGDIEGSATGRLTFRIDTSGDSKARYRGSFLANDPYVSAQGKATSIFGINTDSVVGQVITALGHLALAPVAFVRNPADTSMWESINIFNGSLWRAPSSAFNGVVYAAATNGTVESANYRKFLNDVTGTTWTIDPQFVISDQRSGLRGIPQTPILEISFVTTLKEYYPVETVVADICREINILKSFSQDEKTVVVPPGSNFWILSDQNYGTPYYYSMLASANGLSRAQSYSIRAGRKIKVPPLYLLPFTPQVHFMEPGETIFGICQERFRSVQVGECMSAIAKLNPQLPPSHLYALEAIQLPVFPNH